MKFHHPSWVNKLYFMVFGAILYPIWLQFEALQPGNCGMPPKAVCRRGRRSSFRTILSTHTMLLSFVFVYLGDILYSMVIWAYKIILLPPNTWVIDVKTHTNEHFTSDFAQLQSFISIWTYMDCGCKLRLCILCFIIYVCIFSGYIVFYGNLSL